MFESFDEEEVKKTLPHLFSTNKVPDIQELLSINSNTIPNHLQNLIQKIVDKKNSLGFNEKRFLQWLRFSIAYRIQSYSPLIINKQWSEETHKLLKEEWSKLFTDNDPIAIASMGKLGSGELNLSSDIDLIFFSEKVELQTKLRQFLKNCSTPDLIPSGYKIDLDLRPEGKASPLLVSPVRLGYHLWNNSDPWERYSYTRLNIEIGNSDIKQKVLEVRDKFCYRKYLTSDFFPKFLELRPKYHKSVKNISNHLKLSPGGIRDLELLIQTFQILLGGRDPDLQNISTFEAIKKLSDKNSFRSFEFFNSLKMSYLILRNEEGLLHAFNSIGKFEFDHKNKDKKLVSVAMKIVSKSIEEYSNHWNTQFKQRSLKPVTNKIFDELKIYAKENNYSPDIAVENFKSFFKEKSFSQYVSAIANQESLKTIFFDLLCISPFGCQILARRPSLLDLFILRVENIEAKSLSELTSHLSDLKMVQQILSSLYFSKNENLTELSQNLSQSYENIIKQILNFLDCSGKIDLLFLGKAAGRELGLKSDLDFIITNNTSENQSKLCREVFKILSTPSAFGPLVPFDNRGGPQGSASPLAVKRLSLIQFIENEAEPWQRLMYLKNRLLIDNTSIKFKMKNLSAEDQSSLNSVLNKRLKVTDPQSVYFKTAPGGLFHIEFIVSNIFLKLRKFPDKPSLESWIQELSSELIDSADDLKHLYENFIKLRHLEQKWCVSGYKKSASDGISSEEVQSLLNQNISLIDSVYKNNLG